MKVLTLNTVTGRQELVVQTGLTTNALVTEVYNLSGSTILKGSVVYINGSHGNLPTIALSKANAESTSSKTYGIVDADIADNSNGFVVASGLIGNLDTFALTEGNRLYLSPTVAGGYSLTKPTAPNHAVFIGVCTRSHPTQGTIQVNIQNGFEMDELHDVSAISPANKDILRFNTSTNLWEKNDDLTTVENTILSNNGMGARIVPVGATMYIAENYESVVTRRAYINGRLVLNGKLSVIF